MLQSNLQILDKKKDKECSLEWFGEYGPRLHKKKSLLNPSDPVKKMTTMSYYVQETGIVVISVYSSSLPIVHLIDAPRRRLIVTGIVQGYRTKLLRVLPGSFNVLGV